MLPKQFAFHMTSLFNNLNLPCSTMYLRENRSPYMFSQFEFHKMDTYREFMERGEWSQKTHDNSRMFARVHHARSGLFCAHFVKQVKYGIAAGSISTAFPDTICHYVIRT